MSPFSAKESKEIRRRDRWTCTDCGRSSFDKEQWLTEAAHESHERDEYYHDIDNGKTRCRICHFIQHIDMGDFHGANAIANRIWRTGLRHYSVYERSPGTLLDDRVEFSEMMTAMELQGKIHITEKAVPVGGLRKMFPRAVT